jgi:hypothetical protein
LFYHSLLQETSAGRNLITVFSTVNILSQLFFATRAWRWSTMRSRSNEGGRTSPTRNRAHRLARMPRASNGAACSDHAHASMHARTKYAAFSAHLRDAVPSLSLRTNRSRAKRCLCALHKPVCAKLREHFRASKAIDAPPSRFSLPRKTKDPRRFHRGSRHGVRLDARVSGLLLPAAPRRRPGRATR